MSKKAAKGKASGKSRGDEPDKLTALQLAFVEQYCITLNASEALRRIRKTHDITRQAAHQLRRNPKVDDEITRRVCERSEHNNQLRREVIEALTSILRANVDDVIDLETGQIKAKIPLKARRALSEINFKTYEGGTSTRVKLADKGVAAERLAKLLGMFEKADPLEQEREQIRDADTTISGRIGGLRARLVPRSDTEGPGADGSGAKSPPL
jgi:phage terminase small subunit